MTISIKGLETINISDEILTSDIISTSQNIKFVLLNSSNKTIYLTMGSFKNITTTSNWFQIQGNPIVKTSEQKYTINLDDGDSAELSLSSKLIQSRAQAVEIGQNITKNFFFKKISYDIKIFGNPYIQIGDIVNFIYNYGKINISTPTKKYIVTSINHGFENGLTTSITIRPLEKS